MKFMMNKTLFESTRLQLTAWYVFLIMLVSVMFSAAFYQTSTRELQHVITRFEVAQQFPEQGNVAFGPTMVLKTKPMLEDLYALKQRSLHTLMIVNALIFLFSSGASYLLAGRTLQPIQEMVDEQQDFISNASHELRTPLATLKAEMETSLLEKRLTDQQARQLITSNLEEINTLQTLTNNLLRLTRIHTVNGEKTRRATSLQDVVAAARKKVAILAKQKNLRLVIDVSDVIIQANEDELIEVLVILLDNAIKYSPAKSLVGITSRKHGNMVVLSVVDQGQGIANEDLPHIFERFYRADKSRSQDGYGLGLSIAQKVVESHGGTLTVQSTVGQGTTFILRLPLA